MAVISGMGGAVNGANTVRNWEINYTADDAQLSASNSQEGTIDLAGNTDWKGKYSAYGGQPASMPGEALAFQGGLSSEKGASGTAIVDSIEVVVDIEAGKAIEHTVNFSGNGTLTLGTLAVTDVVTPNPPSSIGCDLQAAPASTGGSSYVALTDIRTMRITITADNQVYVSSDTSGSKRRVAGPIKGTMAVTVYADDPSTLPSANAFYALKIYVSATTYWTIKWAKFKDATMPDDIESGKPVEATLNYNWSAFAGVGTGGTATIGTITLPDSSVFWPSA